MFSQVSWLQPKLNSNLSFMAKPVHILQNNNQPNNMGSTKLHSQGGLKANCDKSTFPWAS